MSALLRDLGMTNSLYCAPASEKGKKALQDYCMKKETRILGPWADKAIYMGQDLIQKLRPWQAAIKELVTSETPHPRKIFWVYDEVGGAGKSSFAKYMYFHHKIITLTFGDAKDLLYVVQKFQGRTAYMFDLSRTKGGKTSMSDIYQALEAVKNGMFVSSKYESDICLMSTPHVVVFSNHKPNMDALSKDRFSIIDFGDLKLGAKGAKEIIGEEGYFQRSASSPKKRKLDALSAFVVERKKKVAKMNQVPMHYGKWPVVEPPVYTTPEEKYGAKKK